MTPQSGVWSSHRLGSVRLEAGQGEDAVEVPWDHDGIIVYLEGSDFVIGAHMKGMKYCISFDKSPIEYKNLNRILWIESAAEKAAVELSSSAAADVS